MRTKPIFNLHLTYEEALAKAQAFQKEHKDENGNDLYIWEDPKNLYEQSMKFDTNGFFPKTFDSDIKDEFEVGDVDKEARAMLIWLMERHHGFNDLQLGQVIVGIVNDGIAGDQEVAIFTYLSKEDDAMRDFIYEKAYELTNK